MPANGRVTLAATLKFPTRHFVALEGEKGGILTLRSATKEHEFRKEFTEEVLSADGPP
jgi:hypothetical protein